MTPEQWRQIAQNNIFPGESGGDYGALYGYSGREGGQFAGVDPSRMTINQLLEFQDPSGPYGQWVKSQNNGTVSTPVGAYQIVGRTLRGAVQDMGLTGNEVFSPQMQDAIGLHIYNTQGPSAWEGWRGNGESVSTRGGDSPTAVAADTRAALGLLDNGGSQMTPEQQPRGLLGMLGIQKRDEAAGGQTAQPFYQRDNFANTMGNLAVGFNSMRLNPDQNIPQMVNARRQGRQQEKMANRTIEWLASQPGGERFAELARAAGPQAALQAYQASRQGPDQTSGMQNYQFMIANGIDPQTAMERAFGGGNTNINMPAGIQVAGDYLIIPDPEAPGGVRQQLIQGSETEREMRAAERAEATRAAGADEVQEQKESVVGGGIDKLVGMLDQGGIFNLPEAGIVGNALGALGVNQQAVDFRNELATVQANIAFDRLQQMREASKTGGALGGVSERELDLLMNAYGNLNQSTSPDLLRENLLAIKRIMTKIENDPVASQFYYGQSAPPAAEGGGDGFSVTGRID